MPKYEYACKSCGERTEVKQSFKDDPLTECSTCGGVLRKVFSSPGIVLKGPGFYRTDHRSPYRPDGMRPAEKEKDREERESSEPAKATSESKDSSGSGSGSGGDGESRGREGGGREGGGEGKPAASGSTAGSTSGGSKSGGSQSGSSGDTGGSKDTARTA